MHTRSVPSWSARPPEMFHEHYVDGGGSSQHFSGKQFERQDGWLVSAECPQSVCIVWPVANNLAKIQQCSAGSARQQSRIIRWGLWLCRSATAHAHGDGWRLKPRLRASRRDAAKAACAASRELSTLDHVLEPAQAGFAVAEQPVAAASAARARLIRGDSESEMADAG